MKFAIFGSGSEFFRSEISIFLLPLSGISPSTATTMVWGLFPVGSLPGTQKYYIFAKGTYKVGRKDCDVIIQTDRAVSRLHAEIIIDAMSPESTGTSIRVRDHSKFGTFINKEQGNRAVHSCPNKEVALRDGDLVSFGTGNASFRFCFVTLMIFVGPSKIFKADSSLQAIISSLGAHATHNWSPECTHVLADESSPVTGQLIDAIILQKPIIQTTWLKVLAERGIRPDIPDCNDFTPALTINGASVKIMDPKVREKCLEGYTFILGAADMYMFGDKLASLLPAFGANILHTDEFSSSSQTSTGGDSNQLVLVNPTRSVLKSNYLKQIGSLARVNEAELVRAVLLGHWEISKVEPPPILVSSSHSTDETVVADSDVEVDTATSNRSPPSAKLESKVECENDVSKSESREENCGEGAAVSSENFKFLSSRVQDSGLIQRKYEGDDLGASAHQNTDIIYSQDLIVKNITVPAPTFPVSDKKIVNFKRFRKTEMIPGNSFKDLISFAKDPYNESDFQNNDVTAFMRGEKKRKQMEAVAEDLFNNAKAKKRGAAGSSILSFFIRS